MPTAQIMGEMWGAKPADWAELGEPPSRPVYEAAFERIGVGRGTRLLDAGCGAGTALQLARSRGADVAGVDASEPLARLARSRLPGARIEVADLESMPFESASFDAVTGFNSFQFAGDIPGALREAQRVCRPGGHVVMCVWGTREQCESFAHTISAVMALGPPPPPAARAPLSTPGLIEDMMGSAGLTPLLAEDVDCPFEFPDVETAVRCFLSPGLPPPVRQLGDEPIARVIRESLQPFTRADGTVRQNNVFHWVLGKKATA